MPGTLVVAGGREQPIGFPINLLLDAAEAGLDVAEGLGAVHRLTVEPLLEVFGDPLLVRREQAMDGLQYGEAAFDGAAPDDEGHGDAESDAGGGEDVAEADGAVEPPAVPPHGLAVVLRCHCSLSGESGVAAFRHCTSDGMGEAASSEASGASASRDCTEASSGLSTTSWCRLESWTARKPTTAPSVATISHSQVSPFTAGPAG